MTITQLRFGDDPDVTIVRADARAAAKEAAQTGLRPSLVYIDPPFAAARDFSLIVDRRGKRRRVAFSDKWTNFDEYMAFMQTVLEDIHDLLAEDGALLLHCDYRAAPYLAVACDQIFGNGDRGREKNAPGFRNELIWSYGLGGSSARCYPKKHDSIFWYTKSSNWFFDPPMVPATSQRMAGQMKKATDVFGVASINNMARERTGYPTQKPLELLERLIRAHTQPGDLVVDLFSGSGTTAVAASRLGRPALVSDIGPDALDTTMGRLIELGTSFEFRGALETGTAPPRDGPALDQWTAGTPLEAVFSGEIAGQEVLLTGYEDWRGVTLRTGTARLDDNGAYATDEWVYVRDTEGRRWCSGT
jgi:DNA modification methylase